MANTIKPKRSYTASNTPTLASAEIGINAADGKIWIGNAAGNANVLVSSLARSDHTGTLTVANGGTGLGTLTANNVILGNGTSTPNFVAPGSSGNLLTSNGTTWESTAPAASSGMPTGAIMPFAAISPPTGYLRCDGSAVSRTTYATLFSTISPSRGTITVTIASPAVVTLSAHGFQTGDIIYLTTTGALPTGLAQNTLYYVINVTTSTFRLATSAANAAVGTAINTSGTQSGTHTLFHCPYGLGNGSTTFNVPDMRSRVGVGLGQGSGLSNTTLGETVGTENETLTSSQIPAHSHPNTVGSTAGGSNSATGGMSQNTVHSHGNLYAEGTALSRGFYGFSATGGGYSGNLIIKGNDAGAGAWASTGNSASLDHTHNLFITNANNTGGGGSHNNMQPSIGLNYIIKT